MGPIDNGYDGRKGPRSADEGIAELAGRQHGVVGRAQLVRLGLSGAAIDGRVRAGRLFVLHRGVYAVGHMALTARSRELAAVLAYGPQALLSHRSAGALWGLLRSSSARVEVTAPRGRKAKGGITLHRSRTVHPDERATVDGVPVTTVARTLVDLADVLSQRRLANAVNEAELSRLFDLHAVEASLERLPGRRGRRRLERVLAAYRPEPRTTRSNLERRLLRICATHGLPTPQANLWIEREEVDFYWPESRLALEMDGTAVHTTRRAFHEDRRRDRRLAALGIQVARVTELDLEDGETLAAELRALLAARTTS